MTNDYKLKWKEDDITSSNATLEKLGIEDNDEIALEIIII
jgi:hypothetical protein